MTLVQISCKLPEYDHRVTSTGRVQASSMIAAKG